MWWPKRSRVRAISERNAGQAHAAQSFDARYDGIAQAGDFLQLEFGGSGGAVHRLALWVQLSIQSNVASIFRIAKRASGVW